MRNRLESINIFSTTKIICLEQIDKKSQESLNTIIRDLVVGILFYSDIPLFNEYSNLIDFRHNKIEIEVPKYTIIGAFRIDTIFTTEPLTLIGSIGDKILIAQGNLKEDILK